MSLIVLFLVFLSLVSCDPIPLPSPSEQVIIEQPSGHVTIAPLEIPTQLSRGERLTMATPGFRIGDVNEPIEIIPPPIGNWVDAPESGQAVHEITTANPTNTANTTNTTNTTSTEEGVIANNPWSAMTGINVTSESQANTTTTTSTPTPSPTWIDIQSDRESQLSRRAPRPAGFPGAPNITSAGTSFNMTIHGNLTSFNFTAHNMTSNHSSASGMWSFLPGGGESYITGNLTGSHINMTVIAPNTTISIISNPNGTTTVSTNTSVPTTTPTPTAGPSKPTDTNTTTPSSAMLHVSLSWSLVISIVLSSIVVC